MSADDGEGGGGLLLLVGKEEMDTTRLTRRSRCVQAQHCSEERSRGNTHRSHTGALLSGVPCKTSLFGTLWVLAA